MPVKLLPAQASSAKLTPMSELDELIAMEPPSKFDPRVRLSAGASNDRDSSRKERARDYMRWRRQGPKRELFLAARREYAARRKAKEALCSANSNTSSF